jgi:starch synthase
MPSRFEPCGLNQMYSLRYGAIPVARATGGLDDSIVDPIENLEHANGIKFFEPSSRALAKAIRKALVLYQYPDLLRLFRRNAMTVDFSWDRTARQYLYLYGNSAFRCPDESGRLRTVRAPMDETADA